MKKFKIGQEVYLVQNTDDWGVIKSKVQGVQEHLHKPSYGEKAPKIKMSYSLSKWAMDGSEYYDGETVFETFEEAKAYILSKHPIPEVTIVEDWLKEKEEKDGR